jgi:anti-sigma B factor antagonist
MVQEINVADTHVQVNLSGSMYVEEAATLRASLNEYIDKGHKNFVVDLGAVDYIDSTGLGTFLHILKRTRKNGGSVSIKGLNGLVKEVFEMTRVGNLFEIQ